LRFSGYTARSHSTCWTVSHVITRQECSLPSSPLLPAATMSKKGRKRRASRSPEERAEGAYSEALRRVRKAHQSSRTILDLSGISAFAQIPPLDHMRNITELNLNGTSISDLHSLAGLVWIEGLQLANTRVHDLSPLRDLRALRRLNLSGTPVHDLSSLTNLK